MNRKNSAGIHKGSIALWTLVGLLLLVVATAIVGGWSNAAFWSSVLVNLGTTIFLAGFLVWLERRLVQTTRTVAREVASEAASEAASKAADEATRVLGQRIDAIQTKFEQRLAAQEADENSAVSSLLTEVSYENVMRALTAAHEMSAVGYMVFVSAGSPSAEDLVVGVGFSTYQEQTFGGFADPVIVGLQLKVDTSLLGTAYVVEADWAPEDDPIAVLSRLRSEMVRVGYGPHARRFNFDQMFRYLSRGLEDAVAGRRGDKDAWRTSATLIDLIDADWVVSEAGIEHRSHGLVAKASILSPRDSSTFTFELPETPEWTDEATWERVVRRARHRLVDQWIF